VIDLEPDKPQGYYQMAILEVKSKNLPEALKYTDKALQVEPNFLPALQLKVRIYQDQKQPDKALAAARQILARSPKNPQLHQMLGELLLIQRQPQAAIAPLEEAIALNPRPIAALQLLALAYKQMPDSDKAVQQLEEKTADPKASPYLSLVLASIYEQEHKYDKAINIYNGLLARNVLTPLARNNQAYLIAEYEPTPENLTRAQKLISQTLEDFPEDPSFLDTMGWVLCKQGNFVEARTYLEKALDKAQNQPVVLYHLGWCEAKLGEAAAARENLQKALDSKIKFPQREEAQKLLESLSAEDKAG
jgi:tetratricopeptide (TPR) repeat protein